MTTTINRKTPPNPLRIDPTRTYSIRQRMSTEVIRELANVRRDVLRRLVTDDSLGIRSVRGQLSGVERVIHLSDSDKLEHTKDWIASLLKERLDTLDTDRYVEQLHERGLTRAFDDVRKPLRSASGDETVAQALGRERLEYVRGSRDEFIKQAQGRRDVQSRKDILHTRIRNEFESLSHGIQSSVVRATTDALSQGKSLKEFRESLNDIFEKASSRANRMVSNEGIRVFTESQLDGFEVLGIERVGVAVEWGTAGDDKVCSACSALGSVVLSIREARGMLPRHVGCRCAWVPYGVGKRDSYTKPKRTQAKIQGAIRKSKKTGIGSSQWAKGKRISKKRPPVVSKVEQTQNAVHTVSLCCGMSELYRFITEGTTDERK